MIDKGGWWENEKEEMVGNPHLAITGSLTGRKTGFACWSVCPRLAGLVPSPAGANTPSVLDSIRRLLAFSLYLRVGCIFAVGMTICISS